MRTFASPAGSKKSAVGHVYSKMRAPDKGAVGVHLGGPDMLILNMHLCGDGPLLPEHRRAPPSRTPVVHTPGVHASARPILSLTHALPRGTRALHNNVGLWRTLYQSTCGYQGRLIPLGPDTEQRRNTS